MSRRLIRSVIIVAAALIIGVLVQAVRPSTAQGGYRAPRLAGTKVPDISGFWQALNTANWDIQTHHARAALTTQPGPGGDVPAAPFVAAGAIAGVPGGLGVVEGNEIPYKPEALAIKKENFANALTRDPEVKCYLPGIPRAMYMPYPFQIVQSNDRILMAFEYATANRVIELGEVGPALEDTWMGRSVGRWDGETLVVDVTNLRPETWFDRAGNFHSDAVHLVERITRIDANTLDYEVQVEDPNVFTRPWKMRMQLHRRREPNMQLMEFKCVEFVEELFYGHLRREQLVRHWGSATMDINITRKIPPLNRLYER